MSPNLTCRIKQHVVHRAGLGSLVAPAKGQGADDHPALSIRILRQSCTLGILGNGSSAGRHAGKMPQISDIPINKIRQG